MVCKVNLVALKEVDHLLLQLWNVNERLVHVGSYIRCYSQYST